MNREMPRELFEMSGRGVAFCMQIQDLWITNVYAVLSDSLMGIEDGPLQTVANHFKATLIEHEETTV